MLTWTHTDHTLAEGVVASPERHAPVASPDMAPLGRSLRFRRGYPRCIRRLSPTPPISADEATVCTVPEPMTDPIHLPVMTAEVVDALKVETGGVYLDCTVGEGGHAEAVVRAADDVSLLGIDLDRDALRTAESRLSFSSGVELVHGNSADVARIASDHGATPVNGVLFDLGTSSLQLDTPQRGFSFRHEAPLDMRFNSDGDSTADDIVNRYPERELEAIIRQFGEQPRARAVAAAIVRARRIETTTQLASVIARAMNRPGRGRIHPATRTFQALRIAVNGELDNLSAGLAGAIEVLGHGGRLVVISYHSLEDRIVKDLLRREASECICPPSTPVCICGHTPSLRLINRRVMTPSAQEVASNPRSRSAKMRIAERL